MRWRWLLVLPVALALVLLATASRLQVFWWPDELHDVTAGTQGQALAVTDRWEDEGGDEHRRELTLTLLEVVPATQVEGFSGPEPLDRVAGSSVWEVRLRFEVDPDVPLGGCQVSLVDTRGREASAAAMRLGRTSVPPPACEPPDRPGPRYDGSRVEGADPRPPAYEVSVLVVTDDHAQPDLVRVWWEAPDAVEFSLSGD
ncbi:hypothetical protein LRP67_08130 [Nocardioides sp. cx-169]|uniref:hypothetical protein n=1 Tax=Nocardioides sp. cx-169 TaxID=2899080 RepID=UPI001E363948|nr:hypothetical protein [Nocardioides sp. cx-169]MCD4534043.1 hypothetical protein [Nocardioides sp. cx-169]